MKENKTLDTKRKRAKVIVASEDELTDLLRKISNLNDENILLTFAESSDLLISPINLKTLQEICDELKKNLILQIIQNPTGIRNAKIANIITTESPSDVEDELWIAAAKKRMQRENDKKNALKNIKEEDLQDTIESLNNNEGSILQDSEYQTRVQQVIDKSKNLIENDNKKVIEEEDWAFAVGKDIDEKEKASNIEKKEKDESLVGKNFNNISELKKIDSKEKKPFFKKAKEKNEKPKIAPKDLKKKIILASSIVLGAIFIATMFAYYTLPLVKIKIYVESKSIEVEKYLKGDTSITEFDLEDGEIPIRQEEITVSRSDSANTTGTGTRGTKAEGSVTLKYFVDAEKTTVPSGTVISTDDQKFEITKNVEIEGPGMVRNVPARALEPGAEYNLSAGNIFSVTGFNNLSAENDRAFSGGLSEEYSKLTQEDYDKLLEKLTKDAFEDGIKRLEDKNPEWELIEESLKQEVESQQSDIPVDGEGNLFNLSVNTVTTGLFYNKEEILEAREEIIKNEALEKDLFTSNKDLNLELDKDIETIIAVENIDGTTISIKFTAKGYIRATVNTDEINESLSGLKWDEGIEEIEKIRFSDKKPKVEFHPSYFSDFLRHFPSRESRILIETKLIDSGDEEEE